MKAQEVLRRYAAGERDFRNAALRGANFAGQDLSTADFSGADIRSANFTNANLRGVNFTHTRAGFQGWYISFHLWLIFSLAAMAGIFQGLVGVFSAFSFSAGASGLMAGSIYLLFVVVVLLAIERQGFTSQTLAIIIAAFSLSLIGASLLLDVVDIAVGLGAVSIVAFASAAAVSCLIMLLITFVFGEASNSGATLGLTMAAAFVSCLIAIGTAVGAAIIRSLSVEVAGVSGFISTAAAFLFGFHIAQQSLKENQKFSTVRAWAINLCTSGGCSFRGADLSGVDFSHAYLQGSNFADSRQQETNFTHISWKSVKNLNRAHLGESILQDFRVRILLSKPEGGYKKDFTNANLQGANLNGVTLEGAILRRAILSGATLEKAILKDAVLAEAQALGANFTSACLTGATLESWNTNSTTSFKDVDCQYVFLREHPNEIGNRERRPYSPNKVFKLGDFETFFKEMPNEVQILIRDGIDIVAFRAAMQNVIVQHPGVSQKSLKAIEIRNAYAKAIFQVPEGMDKAIFEQAFDSGYHAGLKAGKDEERLKIIKEDREIIRLLAQSSTNIYNQNLNEMMNGNDQSQKINVKRDFTVTPHQSVVSLRDISGQVNNQIAQLSNETAQAKLRDLLAQLQTAIETDPKLSEAAKTKALEEVKEIAAAGQTPQNGPMKDAAKQAITMIRGITLGLGETTKFVEACNGLLPAIALLFGL